MYIDGIDWNGMVTYYFTQLNKAIGQIFPHNYVQNLNFNKYFNKKNKFKLTNDKNVTVKKRYFSRKLLNVAAICKTNSA